MGKMLPDESDFIFEQIFVKHANNEDRHKISDKFDLDPTSTKWGKIELDRVSMVDLAIC